MGIYENIQVLCQKNNLLISHLEKKLSFSNGSIRRWNESSPSTDKLQKVADYFKISIDHLIYGFNRQLFASTLSLLKSSRTKEQFADDSGIDINELSPFLTGTAEKQPSTDMLIKLIETNIHAPFITAEEIFKDAGYDAPEQYKDTQPIQTPTLEEKNELGQIEAELLRIMKTLNIKDKTVILTLAYELEEKNKSQQP
jgi:transcriptional regulator with XRE-family HTH domain